MAVRNICDSTTLQSKPLLHFMATLDAYILLTTACRPITTKRKYTVAFPWPQLLRERPRVSQCNLQRNIYCLTCLLLISYIFNQRTRSKYSVILVVRGDTRWRSWLRHCATRRKVAGSNPDGVIGIFSLTSFWPHYGPGVDSAGVYS